MEGRIGWSRALRLGGEKVEVGIDRRWMSWVQRDVERLCQDSRALESVSFGPSSSIDSRTSLVVTQRSTYTSRIALLIIQRSTLYKPS